jgi:hypothetical protein
MDMEYSDYLCVLLTYRFIYELIPRSWVLEKPPVAQLLKNQHFMKPKVSLLCLQEPSIGPYPEPDKCSP